MELRKKGIVPLLLADGGQRAMAWTEHAVVRKGENLASIGLEGIREGDLPPTHRAGKKRIPNDGNGAR